MKETKEFWRSSEFWILIATLLGALTGIFPGIDGKWRSILATGAAGAYGVSRGLAKSGVPFTQALAGAAPAVLAASGHVGAARAAEGVVKAVAGAVEGAHGVTHLTTTVSGDVAHTIVSITHPVELPGAAAQTVTDVAGSTAETVTGATEAVAGVAETVVGGIEGAVSGLLHRKPKK